MKDKIILTCRREQQDTLSYLRHTHPVLDLQSRGVTRRRCGGERDVVGKGDVAMRNVVISGGGGVVLCWGEI